MIKWNKTWRVAALVVATIIAALFSVRADAASAPLTTVVISLAENQTYVIPDHTSHLINTNPCQISNTSLTFPANPVDGQNLMISSAYNIMSINLNGNGHPVQGPEKISIRYESGVLYNYGAAVGWVSVLADSATHCNAKIMRTASALGAGGWQFRQPSSAYDLILDNNRMWLQCEAGGAAKAPSFAEFWCQNTIDVQSVARGNGVYATSGFYATIGNSSAPFGPGAPNDKQVEMRLVVTCRNLIAGTIWPGSLPGAGAWLQCKNGPFFIGDEVLGQRAMVDDSGNFALTHALANTSEYRTTASGGTVTIADNVSTAILAGGGAQTVLFPATPINGQELTFTLATAYTTITLDGNGKKLISGAAWGLTAGSFAKYKYRSANATWYRIG